MKPSRLRSQSIRDFRKLINSHLGKLIIVDNRPAARRLTLDNITRGRLTEIIAINTVVQLNTRLKPGYNLLRSDG